MNTYKVTYVGENAAVTGSQTMAVDSVSAADYSVTDEFIYFTDDQRATVAAYATHRVVSILTTSGAQAS